MQAGERLPGEPCEIRGRVVCGHVLSPLSGAVVYMLDGRRVPGERGRTAVVGEWLIESKPFETTTYNVPAELKAQFASKKQAFRTKIERL